MNKKLIATVIFSVLLLVGCKVKTAQSEYQLMTMKQAQETMEKLDDYVIVDVRTQSEYEEGHIPGAIWIANEQIKDEKPMELSNLEQHIFVYCRSGNRSRQATQKLLKMGYTNVVDIGGINQWDGELEK